MVGGEIHMMPGLWVREGSTMMPRGIPVLPQPLNIYKPECL